MTLHLPPIDAEAVEYLRRWYFDFLAVRMNHPTCRETLNCKLGTEECCDIHRALGASWVALEQYGAEILDTSRWFDDPNPDRKVNCCAILSPRWWHLVGRDDIFEEMMKNFD